MEYVYTYFLIINAIGFVIMLIDKQKAKKKKWRIPERVLMCIAASFGSVGVLLGMLVFRHKTRHLRFIIGVPVLLVLQLIGFLMVYHI